MMELRDLYVDLEVSAGATPTDVKDAWIRCARKYHPDHHPDDPVAEERFKRASSAYGTLSDPIRRKHYDNYVWPLTDATQWEVDPCDLWGVLEKDALILFREEQKRQKSRYRGGWKTYKASSGRTYRVWRSMNDDELYRHYRERARGWEGEEARAAWRHERSRRPHPRPGPIWPQLAGGVHATIQEAAGEGVRCRLSEGQKG